MSSQTEFFIFRDSRRSTTASVLTGRIRTDLQQFPAVPSCDHLVALLLRAGELECALCDAKTHFAACDRAEKLTDLFAQAALANDTSAAMLDRRSLMVSAQSLLDRITCAVPLSVSTPEGFAYYALHPLDYADVVTRLRLDTASALVLGIRSIGTTLSAVVVSALRKAGCKAERTTVRPTGDPYERACYFDQAQQQTIAHFLRSNAAFLVCDEGPGRSGSSLLSVAEALEREGVPRNRIVILCSHEPDAEALCAHDAARRWRQYRFVPAGMTRRLPRNAAQYLGSGNWRIRLIPEGEPWPALWPQMERLRYASPEARSIFTFEGHGPYGAEVRARNEALADAGFAPPYFGQQAGFGEHSFLAGGIARVDGLDGQLLTRIARYCAWRSARFAIEDANLSEIATMTRVNLEREFGTAAIELELSVERPALCDARMMPYNWVRSNDGDWQKFNAAIHGDDHFFPGPCDIAWDLAGSVVEWDLSTSARDFLLAEYQRASGDRISPRVGSYELAYATFRMGWSKMAASSVEPGDEQDRLLSDYRRYRRWVQKIARLAPLPSDSFPQRELSGNGPGPDTPSLLALARS